MTKKQIEQKAKEWCKQYIECNGDCRWCPNERYKDHFIDGADWALFHQWMSVEDELPPASITVLVKTKYNSYFAAQYSAKFEDFLCGAVGIANVTHWMPIPPLAEEGGDK